MKKQFPINIYFLESASQIAMVTVSKYNNKVTLYNRRNYKRISNKRVNQSIVKYYLNSKVFSAMPFSKLKIAKKKLSITPQSSLFNQLDFNL